MPPIADRWSRAFRQLVARRPGMGRVKRRMRDVRVEAKALLHREPFVAPRADAAPDPDGPFLWKSAWIDRLAQQREGDARTGAAIAHVLAAADAAMTGPDFSVVDKLWLPPSGDRHDYYTGGAYWWPVEGAPDGAPWVFRDGKMNPVRFGDEYDLTRLDRFCEAAKALALAYRFTGERGYAERCAALVRTWFLDPARRMTPHLAYSQIVPGARKLTGTGIIETLRFVGIIDAIGLIAPSGALTAPETDAVREWIAEYARWLRDSPNGRLERATNNNHGLSYDIQQMSYALFTGDVAQARRVAEAMPKTRIYRQIMPDGSLPEELRREEAFFYVSYGLTFFFDAATLAERAGVDLWRYRSRAGAGIEPAFRDFICHAHGRRAWPGRGKRVPDPEMYALARRGAWAYDDPSLAEISEAYAARLPLQPVDWTVPRYPTGGTTPLQGKDDR